MPSTITAGTATTNLQRPATANSAATRASDETDRARYRQHYRMKLRRAHARTALRADGFYQQGLVEAVRVFCQTVTGRRPQ